MLKRILIASLFMFSFSSMGNEQQHFEAALDTVAIPQGEELDQMINGLLTAQIQSNPNIAMLRGAFETFYRETFQSEEFIHGCARIQMELFTYEELVEIKEMMDLPIFKKYQKQTPLFIQRNMELGSQVVESRKERLIFLIEKERARIEELKELDEQLNLTGSDN
ncbi:hypothetical protein [Ferrimonas sp.]|uniref:hypothetical protein n=1 Tax=Ferrimonas sp. TaxID=2080861 RepID=UPI003A8D8CAA